MPIIKDPETLNNIAVQQFNNQMFVLNQRNGNQIASEEAKAGFWADAWDAGSDILNTRPTNQIVQNAVVDPLKKWWNWISEDENDPEMQKKLDMNWLERQRKTMSPGYNNSLDTLIEKGRVYEGMSRYDFQTTMDTFQGIEESQQRLTKLHSDNPWSAATLNFLNQGSDPLMYMAGAVVAPLKVAGLARLGLGATRAEISAGALASSTSSILTRASIAGNIGYRIATAAPELAAWGVTLKKLDDYTNWDVNNVNGLQDELSAAGHGIVFGTLLHLGGYATGVMAKTAYAAANERLAPTLTGYVRAALARVPDKLSPDNIPSKGYATVSQKVDPLTGAITTPSSSDPIVANSFAHTNEAQGAKAVFTHTGPDNKTLGQAVRESESTISNLHQDADAGMFHPDIVLLNLHNEANPAGIAQTNRLIKRYEDKGFKIKFLEHPDQVTLNETFQVNKLFEVANQQLGATPGLGTLLKTLAQLNGVMGKTPGFKWMTGRSGVAANSLATPLKSQMYSLFASMADIMEGEASVAMRSRRNAELIKTRMDNELIGVDREAIKIARASGKTSTTDIESIKDQAMHHLLARERNDNLQQQGLGSATKLVHPNAAVEEVANVYESYFTRRRIDLMETKNLDPTKKYKESYGPHEYNSELIAADRAGARTAAKQTMGENDMAKLGEYGTREDVLIETWNNHEAERVEMAIKFTAQAQVANAANMPINAGMTAAEVIDTIRSWKPKMGKPGEFVIQMRDATDPLNNWSTKLEDIYGTNYDRVLERSAENWVTDTIAGKTTKAPKDGTDEDIKTPTYLSKREWNHVSEDMQKYMSTNARYLLTKYGTQIHGRIGVDKAVQSGELGDLWFKNADGKHKKVTNAVELGQHYEQINKTIQSLQSKINNKLTPKEERIIAGQIIGQQVETLQFGLKSLLGQTLYKNTTNDPGQFAWWSRQLMRSQVMVKGGWMGITNTLDFAANAVEGMRPGQFKAMGEALKFELGLQSGNMGGERAFLESINMIAQTLNTNSINGMQHTNRGFGEGFVKNLSERIDYGMEMATNKYASAILLNGVNNSSRRIASVISYQSAINDARMILKAQESGAKTQAEINTYLFNNGYNKFQIGRMYRRGISLDNAKTFLKNVHKHGQDSQGTQIGRVGGRFKSFKDFVNSKETVWFDFNKATKGDAAKLEAIIEGITGEAKFYLNVTPGVLDRFRGEDEQPMIRMLNQFTGFLAAYGTQRLRPMSQMSNGLLTSHIATQALAGWINNSVSAHVSGRQQFNESIDELINTPGKALAKGLLGSGLLGSLTRPWAALGNIYPQLRTNTQGAVFQPQRRDTPDPTNDRKEFISGVANSLGPTANSIWDIGTTIKNAAEGTMPSWDDTRIQSNLPFQNVWALRLLQSQSGYKIPYGNDWARMQQPKNRKKLEQ